MTVTIQNLSGDSLRNLFLSDFTDLQTVLIECWIDGVPVDSLPTDLEFGSVYLGKFTTRWVIGDFADSLFLRYSSTSYSGYRLSLSAGHPYPIFGILPGIGPPIDLTWRE